MFEFSSLRELADATLEDDLKRLLNDGARLEARIVMHLAELDTRKVHLRAGYASLFKYCLQGLGLSEFEAVFRIAAARIGRKFPIVFDMLERRRIHLSAVHLLRHHLTDQNHRELLEEACGKSKRQLESHVSPAHDLSVVVKRGVRAVVAQLETQRFGKRRSPAPLADGPSAARTANPRSATPSHAASSKKRRRIPSQVRRAVAERDNGRCTFVSPDGCRCGFRNLLQIHHEKP